MALWGLQHPLLSKELKTIYFILCVFVMLLTVSLFSATHLSNQHYDVCVRRNRGNCGICWTPTTKGSTTLIAPAIGAANPYPPNSDTGTRGSFGLR